MLLQRSVFFFNFVCVVDLCVCVCVGETHFGLMGLHSLAGVSCTNSIYKNCNLICPFGFGLPRFLYVSVIFFFFCSIDCSGNHKKRKSKWEKTESKARMVRWSLDGRSSDNSRSPLQAEEGFSSQYNKKKTAAQCCCYIGWRSVSPRTEQTIRLWMISNSQRVYSTHTHFNVCGED